MEDLERRQWWQRAVVTAMPTALVSFWWSVVTIDRDDGELGLVLTVGLVGAVGAGLLGMWVATWRAYALGAAVGVAGGAGLAVLLAGGVLATSG